MTYYSQAHAPVAAIVCIVSSCRRQFDTQKQLDEHYAKQHVLSEFLPFSCIICHKRFKKNIQLEVCRNAISVVRTDLLQVHFRDDHGGSISKVSPVIQKPSKTRQKLNDKHVGAHKPNSVTVELKTGQRIEEILGVDFGSDQHGAGLIKTEPMDDC
jgi:hypothetical protein